MNSRFNSVFVSALLLFGIQVRAENGAKYCPNVINKDETTFVVGASCYHYEERPDISAMTYGIAHKQCHTKGAHLMIVRDSGEQRQIYDTLNMKVADSHTVLLGLKRHGGTTWKWVDGSEAKYTNWKRGTNHTQNCARMLLNEGGVWEEFDCGLPAWYAVYVCEYNKHSSSTGNPISSVSSVLATLAFVTISIVVSSF